MESLIAYGRRKEKRKKSIASAEGGKARAQGEKGEIGGVQVGEEKFGKRGGILRGRKRGADERNVERDKFQIRVAGKKRTSFPSTREM